MTERGFKNKITRAKNALKNCTGALEEKLILKKKVKTLEDEFHKWKLNYFDREN